MDGVKEGRRYVVFKRLSSERKTLQVHEHLGRGEDKEEETTNDTRAKDVN